MRSFLISDNKETLLGMKLAGIQGVLSTDKEEILKMIHEKIDDKEIGIIIITDKVKNLIEDELMEIKFSQANTLITEIPSSDGKFNSDFILKYIRDSIGLKF